MIVIAAGDDDGELRENQTVTSAWLGGVGGQVNDALSHTVQAKFIQYNPLWR